MGPKSFVACYVCFKEFGSKSLPFHEPKCLERWRTSNKNLPAEKRTPTPVKPVGWKYSQHSIWVCSHCQVSVPAAKRGIHAAVCFAKVTKSNSLSNKKDPSQNSSMTGVVKSEFSPKKGKENKNISNRIPTPTVSKKNAKNEAKTVKSETVVEESPQKHGTKSKLSPESPKPKVNDKVSEETPKGEEDTISSTSKRSIRPQTKILRRPTPNLKHPVIQVDSDDSSGDSSSSDKSKDDNPKRLKIGSENPDSAHKPKNFVMYNKYNVEKNTKNCSKEKPSERSSANAISSIPNPCNSCNRSQAPERLHSHAKKDSRGLMFRRSPTVDVKMASPQKKILDTIEKDKMRKKEPENVHIEQGDKNERRGHSIKSRDTETKTELTEVISPKNSPVTEPSTPTKSSTELLKPCYICHEEFKVSSLLLHESKCLESWKKTNNSLTPNLRKLPPRRPEEVEIRTPNEDDPAWSAVQSQLVPCPVCGRTFFPERLPVHRRVCKGKPSPRPLKRASSLREQSASSRDGEEQRSEPVYVPCYVCGRSYGSWVISMHEQQCLRKWRRENDKLPDSQQQEEPIKPPESSADDDVASLIELGDTAWESHLQQLVPCPRCSRTFFPDRLEVHERSCKGPSCSRRPRSNKGA